MSVNGPVSGIRFTGLASGLDVESIVTQMINIESIGVNRLAAQQAQLQARQSIYGQFRSQLISLSSTLASLGTSSSYQAVKASSSDDDVVGVSTSSTASAGTYSVEVLALAQSHKTSSSAQASASSALGYAGSFVVNGKAVEVGAGDSLSDVASKINGLGAGVTASVLNGGDNNAFLVINADNTGADSEVQLANLTGSVLDSLGFLSGAASIRDASAGDETARSFALGSGTDALNSVLGSSASGSFSIGGEVVNIDFATDSLQSISSKINALGGSVTATVVAEDGGSVLQLSGGGVLGGITDTDGLLESLGVFQRSFDNELAAATNSTVQIEGLTVSRSTNSIEGVVEGVTFNAEKVGTADVTVSKDTDAIKDSIKGLQTKFNDVIGFIRGNSAFDSETFQTGALFGDQVTAQVETALNAILFNNVGNGDISNLTDIGFGLDEEGKLTLDEARLDSAIKNDLAGVKQLMTATGSSSNSALQYVSSSANTLPSNEIGYEVNITQIATKTDHLASIGMSQPHVGGEILTFSSGTFGSTPVDLYLDAGSTLADVIDKINSDSRLKDKILASDDGGTLKIESKRFGEAGDFDVVSNLAAASDNSGIGLSGGTKTVGVDVAGTINGEEATGNGQFLLGSEDNENTAGLQIQYTGSTTGTIGNMVFNRGISALMNFSVQSFTDSVDGMLTSADKSLTDQVSDIDARIESLRESLALREDNLRRQFAAMENAIAQLNSQGAQLGAAFGGGAG